ncbi:MAG: hypothetical protein ACRD06_05930 [Terriglobia bacterium]
MRAELETAEIWEDVEAVLARLQYNCVMSFMSLWDIAYSNAVFPRFESAPVFLLLAPRLRPNVRGAMNSQRADVRTKESPKFRDMIDVPFSLLFDIISALLRYANNDEFPRNPVALKEMVRLFGKEGKKLDRLRSGRDRITISTFIGLLPKEGPNWELVPLLYAAHTWALKLVPRSMPGERRVIIPDVTYRRFWNAHRSALRASGVNLVGGAVPWPGYLARPGIRA